MDKYSFDQTNTAAVEEINAANGIPTIAPAVEAPPVPEVVEEVTEPELLPVIEEEKVIIYSEFTGMALDIYQTAFVQCAGAVQAAQALEEQKFLTKADVNRTVKRLRDALLAGSRALASFRAPALARRDEITGSLGDTTAARKKVTLADKIAKMQAELAALEKVVEVPVEVAPA